MYRKLKGLIGLLGVAWSLAALLAVSPVNAQVTQQGDLAITLTLKRVEVGSDGKEALKDTTAVKPGDLVEYQAVYVNKGKQPLTNVAATLPLPKGMDYQARTAAPAGAQASVDGQTFAAMPLTRNVVGADGKAKAEEVPLGEYRALRWMVKQVEPGKSFEVKARARVSQASPGPAAAPAAAAKGATK